MINGPDEAPVDESSQLNCERLIGDGGLRCLHIDETISYGH